MKEITENIKKFRELKNYTREIMADKLEMSLSGYSKLERGDVELTVNKLYKIADIFEVDVSQILNFDASKIFNIRITTINNKIRKYKVTLFLRISYKIKMNSKKQFY